MPVAPNCPACKIAMTLRFGPYGPFYGCTNFPTCDYLVRVNGDTGECIGEPSDGATREARIEAHKAFDRLWNHFPDKKLRNRARKIAYDWLRKQLKLSEEECHISLFDKNTCQEVIDLSQRARSITEQDVPGRFYKE